MISIIDAFALARAKRRSKRVLMIIAIIASGLLFGILYGAIIVSDGVSKSADQYIQDIQSGKYLVKSSPNIPSSVFGSSANSLSQKTIDELQLLQSKYIANQKAIAKKAGVTFDENSIGKIIVPDPYASQNLPLNQRVTINRSSPVYEEYLQKLQSDYVLTAKNKLSDLKQVASKYKATSYHIDRTASVGPTNLYYLKDGKENLSNIGQNNNYVNSDLSTYGYLVASVQNSTYSFMDDSLINRFILPANKRKTNATAIPVVMTTEEAVNVFGKQLNISKEPSNNNIVGRVNWIKKLQDKINGVTYQVCYRNNADISQLEQIAQTNQEIESNKNNSNYTVPSLVYNMPTTPCGDITVKLDTRTKAEIDEANHQIEVKKQLGTYLVPGRHLFTFQIVGVMPASSSEQKSTNNLFGFTTDLLSAQYDSGAMIPLQMYRNMPEHARQENILLNNQLVGSNYSVLDEAGIVDTIVEFSSLNNARQFINNEGCLPSNSQCSKPFYLESFGSNYLLINDLNTMISKSMFTMFPIFLAVAGIIMGITMARVIIDSRRETAIFRAIGAKRIDIIITYMIYSIDITIRVIIFGLVLGGSIALLVQTLFSALVTNYAKVAYGVYSGGQVFNFIGFPIKLLVLLTICIIVVDLLATLPALLRNIRRNPIRDMREE